MSEPVYRNAKDLTGVSTAEVPTLRSSDTWLPQHRVMSSSQLIRALALSCHPIPSVAVTAISAGLVALADLPIGRGALVTGAVFTGQLSIGWSNDYLDAERDRPCFGPTNPSRPVQWSPASPVSPPSSPSS